MPQDNNINRYNPLASNTTYEDVARQGKIAEEENYTPATLSESTVPVIPKYLPGEGVYKDADIPDYASRLASAKYEEPYIAKEISNSYSDALSKNGYRGTTPVLPMLNPYGPKVNIRESHEMGNDGVWRTKYPNYFPGINNEDYYAKRQSGWSKAWNGVGKLALKSALYGAHGIVMLPDKLANMAAEGSYKAALNTDLDKFVDDLDKRIDLLLPHYYRKETEDYNFGQKLFKDTGNFLWNDVIGSGMSFTMGAMLSAWATGGLGVASLGNVGAKIGGRIGAKIAARQAANKSIGSLKNIFNDYVRTGVKTGRNIGEAAKALTLLSTSSAFESSMEANTFMKESEADYKDYYRRIYGRDPNSEELATFRNSNATVGSAIFAANMGIVGLSNWLLFGKYIGLGGKVIPGIERKLNKNLFGLGTEVRKPGEMAIKITNPNIAQRLAGNVFNITKRPISEGLWEEGTQGVVQNAAEEYVKSRYDDVAMNGVVDVMDAIAEGFRKQYTTKEGWTEIGIGAIIGSLFGMREGFSGIAEYNNSQKELETKVNEYNNVTSNLNNAALNTLKKSMSLGPQLRGDSNAISSQDFDDAMFSKMTVDYQMGTLDSSAENFRQMIDMMPLQELAEETGMSIEEASRYKEAMIDNYNERLSDFRSAQGFAEDLIGDDRIEFKTYVARNAYLGLQSETRMKDIASEIESLSNQPRVADALNTFSRLSARARERAIEIRRIKYKIEEIESEIEDLATKPRNVDGKDPQAEIIQRKTKELSRLQSDYANSINELSTLIGKDFTVEELVGRTERITSAPLSPIGAQEVIDAYDALTAFDDYFNVKSRQKKEFTAKDKAMRSLVNEYRNNLVNYRNMNNFLSSILDKRFLEEENRGFTKLLSSLATTEYKGDNSLPDFMESGEVGTYASDDAVDKAVEEGRISEDEAWSLKAFMHSMDRVRADRLHEAEEDVDNMPITESVSDEDYSQAMENLLTVPAVGESIIDKLYTGNADLLTGREKEIYDRYKSDFDDYVSSLGDSPSRLLEALTDRAGRLTKQTDVYEENKAIVDMAKSKLDPEQQKELDEAINKYNDLMNKRDKGEDMDEGELFAQINTIQDLGQIGNITDLLPYIDQNRLIDNGGLVESTLKNFGSEDSHIGDLLNENDEEVKEDGANIDSVQNPEVLMIRKVGAKSGEEKYEVSGLRADRFVSGIKSSLPIQISSETNPNGTRRYFIHINGEIATIIESPYHARWFIDKNSVSVLNKYTDVAIQDISTSYSMVGKRLDSGELVPYRTGVGFGINETDKIDQEALAKIRRGDDVDLVMDVNDTYNQSLISEYENALQSGDKNMIDKAEKNLVSNMVIKIMKDGNFVSVLKADTGGVTALNAIRRNAFNKWKKSAGGASLIELGRKKVAQTLPGRPLFNMETTGLGYGRVVNLPISEKGAENIVDVGYILDGKVVLKKGSKHTSFPFATNMVRDKMGHYLHTRIPVVVIKAKNGLNYLYPVSLRETMSEEGRKWINTIDMLLDPANADLLEIAQDEIQELNDYLTRLGLNPSEYQVSYLRPLSRLKKAKDAIQREAGTPDVRKWVEDGGRDIKDILISDVESGIDFEGEMFVAPKIRISLGSMTLSKASEVEDSAEEEDLPFDRPGQETGSEAEPETEEVRPEPVAPAPGENITASQPGKRKRTSSKSFAIVLSGIESHIKENNLPEYANIYDFIARKIVGGEIVFLRDRKNPKSLKIEAGLDPMGTLGDKVSKTARDGGMTLDEYVSYLRNRPEQVVQDYVSSRSDEQIIAEIKNFLGYIKYVPSKALNYSLRMNGMDAIKEYGSREEIDAMVSAINGIVSTEIPALDDQAVESMTSNLSNGNMDELIEEVQSLMEEDMTAEEKKDFLDDIKEYLASDENTEEENESVIEKIENKINEIDNEERESKTGSDIRHAEDGNQESDEKESGESRTDGSVEGNVELPGFANERVDNYRDNGNKFSNPEQVLNWLLGRIGIDPDGNAYVEGDEVNEIQDDMEKRYGIETIAHNHTTKAIRSLDGVSGYLVEYGLSFMDYKPYIRIQKQASRPTLAEEPSISEETSFSLPRVAANSFIFGGDNAYVSVPAEISPIPENILKRNGIKQGMGLADIGKLGYKRAGGNWFYKFYAGTGLYDMYNINTGEAFRARPNAGVKVNSSQFTRSLLQAGREIQNLKRNISQEEISRNIDLVNESDNSDSNDELNRNC